MLENYHTSGGIRIKREISDQTSRNWHWMEAEDVVARLNRMLLGWSNYFCLGPVTPVYRAIDWHCCYRLRQWLRRKHKFRGPEKTRFSGEYLHGVLGLVELGARTRSFPWARA